MENFLYFVTEDSYQVLKEDSEFIQDSKYILYNNVLIRKDCIDDIGIFKGRICVFTFDLEKVKSYQRMLEGKG